MKRCIVEFEGMPGVYYSQSANHRTPKLHDRESDEDYDARTWPEHCTTNKDGIVCVPAMALKQCVDSAAWKLGMKIPGRRGASYKTFFASGFFCEEDAPIANGKPLTKEDAEMIKISCNPQGIRGARGRVDRRFPQFRGWKGIAPFIIVDEIITNQVFEVHVEKAGMIVGIGRFRPENGGINGRFRPIKFTWQDL